MEGAAFPAQGRALGADEMASTLAGDDVPDWAPEADLAAQIPRTLSPEGAGNRVSGTRYVAFRRSLDAMLRACRSLGDAYVSLYKELKNGPSSPPALWLLDPAELRAASDGYRERLEAIEATEHLHLLRNEGDERIRALTQDFPEFLARDDYRQAVAKAEGLYTEIAKIMHKAPEKVAERLRLLEAYAEAATFRLQAKDLLSWMEEEVIGRVSKMEAEASVSLFRLRVQERQFEAFFGPAQDRLKTAETLVMQSQHLWDASDSTSPLMVEQRAELEAEWRVLLDKVEESSGRLFAFRNTLADSLVAHQMLEKVYDWALNNAKWSSRIGLFLTAAQASPDSSDTDDHSHHPDHDEETAALGSLDEMRRSVSRQLERYPGAELSQLPLYAERLADGKIESQARALTARCAEARRALRESADKLDRLALARQQEGRSSSPTSTVYEEPRGRQQDEAFFARRRSYAGTPGSSVWEVEAVYPPPVLVEEVEDESSPNTITADLTNQVVSSMGDQTLRKRLAERKSSQPSGKEMPSLPLPTSTTAPELERPRPGSARFSRCRRPFARLIKRSTTGDLLLSPPSAPPPFPSSPPERILASPDGAANLGQPTAKQYSSLQSLSSEESLGCLSSSSTKQQHDFPDLAGLSQVQELPALPPRFRLASPPNLTSPDQRIVHNIISELVHTEFAYVHSLHYIIQNYVPELTREDLPQELRGQRYTIFGNVERIYAFHVLHFLPQLKEKLVKAEPDYLCAEVGRVFLENRNRFHLYALYNKNKPKSDALMSEVGTVFFRTRQLLLGDAMDLGSYLLKPVQRMAKYALLLAQLLKACPPEDVDSVDILRKAEEMVTFQLRLGNHLLAMDLIRGCDLNLKEQGQLLRQDELEVWNGAGGIVSGLGRNKGVRRVFLFEQLILFAKAHRCSGNPVSDEAYLYKFSLRMTDVGLTESVGGSERRFELWTRRRGARCAYVIQAPTAELKHAWVSDIRELLWRQARANRAMRKSEASCMGIRDSGVDLTASVDRIESRSISASHLPFPKCRKDSSSSREEANGNSKRPQSLISLSGSSSTSSGSSSSSSSSSGIVANAFPGVVFRQQPPLPGYYLSGHAIPNPYLAISERSIFSKSGSLVEMGTAELEEVPLEGGEQVEFVDGESVVV